jgi:phenylalanyl-tRNA synthetase beta subunit
VKYFTSLLDLSSDIYLFEFDFELIQNQIQQNKLAVYQEYSSYLKIMKEISFIIRNDISFDKLEENFIFKWK